MRERERERQTDRKTEEGTRDSNIITHTKQIRLTSERKRARNIYGERNREREREREREERKKKERGLALKKSIKNSKLNLKH